MLYTPRSYKLFLKIMFTLQVRGDTIEWIFPPRVHHSQHMRRTSPIWANPFWSSAVDSTKYLWNNCFMFTCCLVCSDIMLVHFVAQSVFFLSDFVFTTLGHGSSFHVESDSKWHYYVTSLFTIYLIDKSTGWQRALSKLAELFITVTSYLLILIAAEPSAEYSDLFLY